MLFKERLNEDGKLYFAGDLEKVIMLPRLPGLKKSIFTKRIILFNEHFLLLEVARACMTLLLFYGMKASKGEMMKIFAVHYVIYCIARDVKNVLIL